MREALLTDRSGGVLEATRPGARERGAAPLARAAGELAAAGGAFGLGILELLVVNGASQATLTAVRSDALLVALAQPGNGRSQLEKALRAWVSSPASAARPARAPAVAAAPAPARPAPTRADPWVALRRALARGRLAQATALQRELEEAPSGPPRAGAEPVSVAELDRALHLLVEGIGGVLAGDGVGGQRTLAELALASQPNLSIRWIALHWTARAAIGGGDYDAARERVREALRLVPQLDVDARAVTQWTAAEVLAHKGDPARALAWLGDSRKRFESLDDRWGVGRTWLAEARILVRQGRDAEGLAAARQASAADPAWEDPALFLARRSLASGELAEAREILERLQGPSAERARVLVRAVEDGTVSHADATELVRERDQPPTAQTIAALQRIVDASPGFVQAREALAWMLLKVGRYADASTIFRALLSEQLGVADRASVMLGLGCIAHAQPEAPASAAHVPLARAAGQGARDAVAGSGFSGLLSVLSVPDVLEFLRGARRTGLLVCSSAQGTATLRFQDGWITGLAPSPAGARDEQALGQQIERTIRELVQWKDGEFAFNRDDGGDPEGALPVRIDVQGALLNVFRQMDEDAERSASEAAAGGTVACA